MTPPTGFARRSRLTAAGLVLRRLRHAGVAAVIVAVLTAGVAALVAGIPAGFAAMSADELRAALTAAGPASRNLVSVTSAAPATGPAEDPAATGLPADLDDRYGLFTEQLADVRESFPEPLRSQVGPADWAATAPPATFGSADPGTDPAGATQIVITRAVPNPGEHADLVEGSWPTYDDAGTGETDGTVEIAMSQDSAAHLGWAAGEQHGPFLVSGIFAVGDPDDDYWALNPGMVLANVFDDGNSRPSITVTAFSHPLAHLESGPRTRPNTTKIWYPLDLTGLTGAEVEQILGQLRGVTARTNTLTPPGDDPAALSTLTLTAAAIPVLEGVNARLDAAASVLTVAVIGPVGAAAAVLLLGIRALAARRRDADSLLAVRGAGNVRLRTERAIDGLAVGLLPALLGAAAIGLAFRGDAPVAGLVAGAAVGLVPAVALVIAPVRRHLQRTRPDVAPHRVARLRWLVDVAVCGLAAVSTYLLFAVGVSSSSTADSAGPAASTGAGTDVLVAATPLLLAAVACVVVLRLYPVPLALLVRRLRRSRSAVSFLGAVRGLRDPAVGVAPVLAVVTGMALAMFSAATLSTIDTGTTTAAVERLGGPLRMDGPLITDDRLAQIQALPGVAAAARLENGGLTEVSIDGTRSTTRTELLLSDTAELAAVQAALDDALPGGPVVPAAGLPAGEQQAVLTSPGLVPDGSSVAIGSTEVAVVGTADRVPGFTPTGAWVLADLASGLEGNGSRSVVIATEPGVAIADPVALADLESRIEAITGEATFRTPQDLVAGVEANPVNGGLRTAALVAIIVAALAAGAAVVLTLVLNSSGRAWLLAILQVLGLSARDRRRLVVWEQGPSALVALVVGAGLGIGITVMMRSVIDLRPFTGGLREPELVVDPVLVAGLVGGFVLVVVAAVAVGVLLSRRGTTAGAVKLDDE